jgi:protein-L-isoaspartate O-methyltransferase
VSTAWREYFDALKDQSPLYRVQAALYVDSLREAVGVQRHQRVLDFGCGFGFVTALLAPLVTEVWWWDPSVNMRSVTHRNVAAFANAKFCDLSAMPSTDPRAGSWQGPRFDLILINSVVQYMPAEELWGWLRRWHAMLAPDGQVVLSDLISPDHSSLSDFICLMRLGHRHGTALMATTEALGGLPTYWRTRHSFPLTSISKSDLARQAAVAAFDVTFLPANLTHFHRRWAAVLRLASP